MVLLILLYLLLPRHSAVGVVGEGGEFVFARIDEDRGKVFEALGELLADVLAVRYGTRQDYGIHMSVGGWRE